MRKGSEKGEKKERKNKKKFEFRNRRECNGTKLKEEGKKEILMKGEKGRMELKKKKTDEDFFNQGKFLFFNTFSPFLLFAG